MCAESRPNKPAGPAATEGTVASGRPGRAGLAKLPLPHERDESVGMAGGEQATGGLGSGAAGEAQRRLMEQARRDLATGQVDTDLRATPGLDAERRRALLQRGRR